MCYYLVKDSNIKTQIPSHLSYFQGLFNNNRKLLNDFKGQRTTN